MPQTRQKLQQSSPAALYLGFAFFLKRSMSFLAFVSETLEAELPAVAEF